MTRFRGYYNYFTLLFRVCLLGGSAIMLFKIVWLFVFDLPSNDQKVFELIFGAVFMGGLFTFLSHTAVASQLSQMYNIVIRDGNTVLIHVLSFRKHHIATDEVRGYTTTTFYSRLKNYPCIVLYLKDGKTFEFPQYLFFNYRHLRSALDAVGIKYLGEQKETKNGWFRKRQYKL